VCVHNCVRAFGFLPQNQPFFSLFFSFRCMNDYMCLLNTTNTTILSSISKRTLSYLAFKKDGRQEAKVFALQ
jgi:hypothetical protein